jgi:hypothetical protein
MTLDDVLDLHDYWAEHPPVQWMVQAYLGVGRSNEPEHEPSSDELMSFARTGMPG